MQEKTPSQSAAETRHIVMPDHANHYGTLFGGTLMSWIDMIAVMVAQRHCGKEAVTASVDRLNFIAPIEIGDHVVLRASVNYTGKTSLEVGVQVSKENHNILDYLEVRAPSRANPPPQLEFRTERKKPPAPNAR
ncbi:acyl-CoA thioesterase [Leptospira ellisii]|uniref:acyl-CoA thioesterase n=1 Tax=Leptospira ellisii TaxID=2023197 RepID=UPI001FAE7CC4|nr:acyl-CoA thioesterase [Leptospira ellisii]